MPFDSSFTFSYFHPREEQSLGCLYTMSLACLALTTRGEDELEPVAVAALRRAAFSDCSLRALVELESSPVELGGNSIDIFFHSRIRPRTCPPKSCLVV